jgi:hypothetical protein
MKMENKKQIQEELERLSPLLASLKQQEQDALSSLPPGYFDALPNQVLARIRAENGSASPPARPLQLRWHRQLAYAAGLAAAIALFAIGAYRYWHSSPASGEPLAALENLDQEGLQRYVNDHIEAFDLELILEALVVEPNDLQRLEILPGLKGSYLDQYLDEAIEELSLSDLEELL